MHFTVLLQPSSSHNGCRGRRVPWHNNSSNRWCTCLKDECSGAGLGAELAKLRAKPVSIACSPASATNSTCPTSTPHSLAGAGAIWELNCRSDCHGLRLTKEEGRHALDALHHPTRVELQERSLRPPPRQGRRPSWPPFAASSDSSWTAGAVIAASTPLRKKVVTTSFCYIVRLHVLAPAPAASQELLEEHRLAPWTRCRMLLSRNCSRNAQASKRWWW
jgi:hypothetical protein